MATTLSEARASFPATESLVYLDVAAVSLISEPVHDAVRSFLDLCLRPEAADASLHHLVMDAMRHTAVREGAALLGAAEEEIALVESTTHGLNIAANALPLRAGDTVLIADTEFLQVSIPWKMKEANVGIEMVPVPTGENGTLHVEAFERAIDHRTRVVCVSSVQWCSGYRIDLKALGDLCRERGIYLVVDAIQQLGALDLNVRETPVDFLMAGGHKWLNAPFGCGILYVSPDRIQELDPDSWGYLALEDPEGGWGEYFRRPGITPYSDWSFRQTATKFEIAGTSNYPGSVGLGASLAQINQIGIQRAEKQVLSLNRRLREGLVELGARVISPGGPDEERSGITIFTMGDTPEEDRALLDKLLERKIYLAQRYTSGIGGIRASTHFFNNDDDVDALLQALKELLG
jgi:selenocysteine lyase/cysteine desulfurase